MIYGRFTKMAEWVKCSKQCTLRNEQCTGCLTGGMVSKQPLHLLCRFCVLSVSHTLSLRQRNKLSVFMMMMGSTDTIPHFRTSYFNRGPRQKMNAVRWLRILLDLRKHSIDLTWLTQLKWTGNRHSVVYKLIRKKRR